jgi:hypothetical protein
VAFLKTCLEILLPQCQEVGAEILVGDSTGRALPPSFLSANNTLRYFAKPGASVFDLRAEATVRATGNIVAWTEDHCLPAKDWCAKTLEAHECHSKAALIGGAVKNGSREAPIDWANFLCTFGPLIPPFHRAPARRAPAVANLSFKRPAIPAGPLRPGYIETVHERRLLDAGSVVFDDTIRVSHVQSSGFWPTFAAHFHNGRSTTGLLADTLSTWKRVRQIAICFVMPAELLRTSIVPMIGKEEAPWLRHLPLMIGLAVAFSAGELTGLVLNGAGKSPHRLE